MYDNEMKSATKRMKIPTLFWKQKQCSRNLTYFRNA